LQGSRFENRIATSQIRNTGNTAKLQDGAGLGSKRAKLSLNRLLRSLLGFYLRNCMEAVSYEH